MELHGRPGHQDGSRHRQGERPRPGHVRQDDQEAQRDAHRAERRVARAHDVLPDLALHRVLRSGLEQWEAIKAWNPPEIPGLESKLSTERWQEGVA